MATTGAAQTSKPKGEMHQIGLQIGNLCKTTGWYNNCGLNSLTHFLVAKLSAMSAAECDLFLAENPEYFALLHSFREYYGLQGDYGWQDLLRVLREHPVATDQEAIFAPVLRLHLGKILAEQADMLWLTDASSAVSDYIKSGQAIDVARAVYAPNKVFFDDLREQFRNALIASLNAENPTAEEWAMAAQALRNNSDNLAIPAYQPTQRQLLEHILFQRRNMLEEIFLLQAKQYWDETGCQRYAEYMANMNNAVMVSSDHLQLICKKLNIGLEVYTPASLQSALQSQERAAYTHGAQLIMEGQFKWTMKVLNTGVHWIYQEPDNDQRKAAAHNQYYPDMLNTAFFENQDLSGHFKIFGPQAMNKSLIIAKIKHYLGELPAEELARIQQIVAEAERLRLEAFAKSQAEARARAETAAVIKEPARHACGLFLDIYATLEKTDIGKQYIQLLAADLEVLQTFNQQFQGGLAKLFLDNYGNQQALQKISSLSSPSKLAFLRGLSAKLKPATVAPAVSSTPCHAVTSGHAMQEALMVPSARLILTPEQPRIKLPHLAIMQDKVLLKTNAVAAEIALKAFEANQTVTDAFNAFSPECVIKFATNPKLAELVPELVKLSPGQQVQFLQKYAQSFEASLTIPVQGLSQR